MTSPSQSTPLTIEEIEINASGTSTVNRVALESVLSVAMTFNSSSQDAVSENVSIPFEKLQRRFKEPSPEDSNGQPADDAAITL